MTIGRASVLLLFAIHLRGADPAPPPAAWLSRLVLPPPLDQTPDLPLLVAPCLIGSATDHRIIYAGEWLLPGRRLMQPFSLAGLTAQEALDRIASVSEAGWLLVEEQAVILPIDAIARLRQSVKPPAPPMTDADGRFPSVDALVAYLGTASGLRFNNYKVRPGDLPVPIDWTVPLPAVEVLSRLARANHWTWTLDLSEGLVLVVDTHPAVRSLLEPDPQDAFISGHPNLPSPMEQGVILHVKDATARQVLHDLAPQISIAITWKAGDEVRMNQSVHGVTLRNVLGYISHVTGTTLTEPEIGKRLEFVPQPGHKADPPP